MADALLRAIEQTVALTRQVADGWRSQAHAHRLATLAALDQLHAAQLEIGRLREEKQQLLDERARYARDIFQRTPADE